MAVVKAHYVKRGEGERRRAQATLRYMEHRKGSLGATITRALFGSDGIMERHEAYRMIDEAQRGSLFYRFILSPDPREEDTRRDLDMRELTGEMMMELEEKFGEPIAYVAALHADHAPHRHVHILAIVPFKLRRKDLELLRGRATVACWQQRRLLDLALTRERERPYPFPRLASFPRRPSSARLTGHPRRTRQPRYPSAPHLVLPDLNTCTCPRCSTFHIHHTRDPVHRCTSCGRLLHWQNRQKNIFLTRQEGALERRGKGLRWEL